VSECKTWSQSDKVELDPESIRGAKEWLAAQFEPRRRYSETVDQPAFARLFDLLQARRRAASFDKLFSDVQAFLGDLTTNPHVPH
jgi:hypothetical protein